jgi:16S rRNA (adenine1518-N6/adenine1519-N6)-dimethyltransferase
MPQTLSEIKAALAGFGLRPKRRLGQNFLHDANQMAKVIRAAEELPGGMGGELRGLVLEVGAGTGALSERLLDAGATLVAVELDRGLEPILRSRFERYGQRVRLVMADVLAGKHAVNPSVLTALEEAGRELGGSTEQAETDREGVPQMVGGFKLVANLPYNVASPLLANLATLGAGPLRMTGAVVMVQREVADRLCAKPGSKHYGPLSVMIAAMCHVRIVATVAPGCFWPSPKVDSAVVSLVPHPEPLTTDPDALRRTLHRVFGKRRKQVATILGRDTVLPAGIDPNGRPEQLTVEQWVALSSWLEAPETF